MLKTQHPGTKLSNAQFDEVRRYAKAHYGFAAEMAREMTALSDPPQTWSKQHVSMFFATRAKRHEPRYGTGLLFMRAYENVKARNGGAK